MATEKPTETTPETTPAQALPDDALIATIGIKANGDIAWVDYEDGPYIAHPMVDFSKKERIDFSDPKWGVASLLGVSTYALLHMQKTDGTRMYCVVTPPQWW